MQRVYSFHALLGVLFVLMSVFFASVFSKSYSQERFRVPEISTPRIEKMVALIPGGKHIIVDGVGHNIHMEKPDALINPILDMISDLRNK
jgi:hypothetical protein